MKLHSILSKEYLLWWFILASFIAFKIILFGYKTEGISKMEGYEDYGVLFWIIGMLFTSLIFATPIYLIYRLFSRKWNHRVLMIIISFFVVILTIFSL